VKVGAVAEPLSYDSLFTSIAARAQLFPARYSMAVGSLGVGACWLAMRVSFSAPRLRMWLSVASVGQGKGNGQALILSKTDRFRHPATQRDRDNTCCRHDMSGSKFLNPKRIESKCNQFCCLVDLRIDIIKAENEWCFGRFQSDIGPAFREAVKVLRLSQDHQIFVFLLFTVVEAALSWQTGNLVSLGNLGSHVGFPTCPQKSSK